MVGILLECAVCILSTCSLTELSPEIKLIYKGGLCWIGVGGIEYRFIRSRQQAEWDILWGLRDESLWYLHVPVWYYLTSIFCDDWSIQRNLFQTFATFFLSVCCYCFRSISCVQCLSKDTQLWIKNFSCPPWRRGLKFEHSPLHHSFINSQTTGFKVDLPLPGSSQNIHGSELHFFWPALYTVKSS